MSKSVQALIDYPDVKMYIVVRRDLNMRRGKESAQVGHAVQYMITSHFKNHSFDLRWAKWSTLGWPKIVVSVNSWDELEHLRSIVSGDEYGFPTAIVTDYGHTEINAGTETCFSTPPLEREVAELMGLTELRLR